MEPAPHAAHAVVDTAEYVPAAHAVQVVAPLVTTPVPVPFSATKPAPHAAHATCDDALYCPDPHAVHEEAPVRLSVFVTEPLAQVVQAPAPAMENVPATQAADGVAT
jgi:hypothetical protein